MTNAKMLVSACAFIAIVCAVPASARPDRAITVTYSDLNLSHESDRRMLNRRIDRAVKRLCGSDALARNGFELDEIRNCQKEARANGARQIAALDKVQPLRVSAQNPASMRP